MITYKDKLFVLDTDKTTYAFRVMPAGHLEHLYYGRKIRLDSDEGIAERWEFAPGNSSVYDSEHNAVSMEGIKLEISAPGKGDVRELSLELINADGSLTNRATEGCVLDLTNKISHLVIFDLENITPYSSAYNMSTTDMQKRALKYIKEREPEMIIVSPYIRFDQAPLSLRSFYLYTKIMKMG